MAKMIKSDKLSNSLQRCLSSGVKKVWFPMASAADFGSMPVELVGFFSVISYQTAEYAAVKTLEMENWRHRVWIKHIQFSNRP